MDNDLVHRKSVMDEENNRPQHLFIDFEPWCKDCDVFDPETIDNRATFDDGQGNDFTVGEVIFTCKHRNGCKRLAVKETEELER